MIEAFSKLYRTIKSRIIRWAEHVVTMEDVRGFLKIVTDKLTEKRPLGRSNHRWKNNIRVCLKK